MYQTYRITNTLPIHQGSCTINITVPSATPSINDTISIASSSQSSLPGTPLICSSGSKVILSESIIANRIQKLLQLNKGRCVVNRLYYLFVRRQMATSASMGCNVTNV